VLGRFAHQSSLAACGAGEVWSRIAILAYQSAGPGGFIGFGAVQGIQTPRRFHAVRGA
jgi:hypothetical protein